VRAALEVTQIPVAARINTADDLARGLVFLTVTGTSAESGDDGQTGRGNRANGLITPFRPMTMEAVAGKNPISHVGKLYNTAASRLAAAIVANVGEISEAQCHLLSEIGTPIDEPQLALIRVRTPDSGLARETERRIRDLAIEEIRSIREMWKLFMSGEITVA
jgi:S-adenosylmethionine synthetase